MQPAEQKELDDLLAAFYAGEFFTPLDTPAIKNAVACWIGYCKAAYTAKTRELVAYYNTKAELLWQEINRSRDALQTAKDEAENRGPITQPAPLDPTEYPPEWDHLKN